MSETFGGASYGKKEELVLGAGYPLDEGYRAELHIIEKDTDEDYDLSNVILESDELDNE